MIVYDLGNHGSRDRQPQFLAEVAELLGSPISYRYTGTWDVGEPHTIEELRSAVVILMAPLLGPLGDEPPAFILPGLSSSLAVFLALFHGREGHFPRLIWATGKAFDHPILIDLDEIRAWARRNLRVDELPS